MSNVCDNMHLLCRHMWSVFIRHIIVFLHYHQTQQNMIENQNEDCDRLDFLFPITGSKNVTGLSPTDNIDGFIIQILPTLSVLLFWMFFEYKQRSYPTLTFLNVSKGFGVLVVAGNAILIWKICSVLYCEDELSDTWIDTVAVTGSSLLSMSLLLLLAPRFPRVTVFLFLVSSGGSIFLDWCLRGGVTVSHASFYVLALQQSLCLLSLCAMHNIPILRKRRIRSQLESLDSLESKPRIASSGVESPRFFSWLSVA